MIKMAQKGDLVIVLDRGIRISTDNGVTSEWDFNVNPLGRIVDLWRRWEDWKGRQRTYSYKVQPVDPKAGHGELTFRPSELRRPTNEEVQASVDAGLIHQPEV